MDRGFSLIEVLVASAVMTVATIGLAQLSVASILVNHVARSATFTTVLASQKMAQLQALTWSVDAAGVRISDTTTDTTVLPERSSGGTGLAPSPAGALVQDTPGYCDYLDVNGRTLGGGTAPPPATTYVRRWAIEALSTADTVLIQVVVAPSVIRGRASNIGRHPEEARIIALKTRKSG